MGDGSPEDGKRVCPTCGTEVAPSTSEATRPPPTCPNCGERLDDDNPSGFELSGEASRDSVPDAAILEGETDEVERTFSPSDVDEAETPSDSQTSGDDDRKHLSDLAEDSHSFAEAKREVDSNVEDREHLRATQNIQKPLPDIIEDSELERQEGEARAEFIERLEASRHRDESGDDEEGESSDELGSLPAPDTIRDAHDLSSRVSEDSAPSDSTAEIPPDELPLEEAEPPKADSNEESFADTESVPSTEEADPANLPDDGAREEDEETFESTASSDVEEPPTSRPDGSESSDDGIETAGVPESLLDGANLSPPSNRSEAEITPESSDSQGFDDEEARESTDRLRSGRLADDALEPDDDAPGTLGSGRSSIPSPDNLQNDASAKEGSETSDASSEDDSPTTTETETGDLSLEVDGGTTVGETGAVADETSPGDGESEPGDDSDDPIESLSEVLDARDSSPRENSDDETSPSGDAPDSEASSKVGALSDALADQDSSPEEQVDGGSPSPPPFSGQPPSPPPEALGEPSDDTSEGEADDQGKDISDVPEPPTSNDDDASAGGDSASSPDAAEEASETTGSERETSSPPPLDVESTPKPDEDEPGPFEASDLGTEFDDGPGEAETTSASSDDMASESDGELRVAEEDDASPESEDDSPRVERSSDSISGGTSVESEPDEAEVGPSPSVASEGDEVSRERTDELDSDSRTSTDTSSSETTQSSTTSEGDETSRGTSGGLVALAGFGALAAAAVGYWFWAAPSGESQDGTQTTQATTADATTSTDTSDRRRTVARTLRRATEVVADARQIDPSDPELQRTVASRLLEAGRAREASRIYDVLWRRGEPADLEWTETYLDTLRRAKRHRRFRDVVLDVVQKTDDEEPWIERWHASLERDSELASYDVVDLDANERAAAFRPADSADVDGLIVTNRVGERKFVFQPATEWRRRWRDDVAAWRLCRIVVCRFEIPRTRPARISRASFRERFEGSAPLSTWRWVSETGPDGETRQYLYGALRAWPGEVARWPIEEFDVWRPWLRADRDGSSLEQPVREALAGFESLQNGELYEALLAELDEGPLRPHAAQLSSIVVFDYLTNNWGRFRETTDEYGASNHFADGSFVTLGTDSVFQPRDSRRVQGRFEWISRFGRDTITSIRILDRERVSPLLYPDPSTLEQEKLEVFWKQRDALIARVDRLVERYGRSSVLAFD
jgi:hypothetical protein